MAMNVKKGDTVIVLSGKDKGKQGKVLGTVQVGCPKCGKGTRVAHKVEGGKKTRVCKKCGAEL